MKFNELNLTRDLMRGIEEAGFTDCTPVQEQTFKLVLEEGRDATVQSQTGTGKTAAFLISIFEIFERASRGEEGGNRHAALVVVPTRELAVQVTDEAKLLGSHLAYRVGSVFGGVGYGQQERLLQKGADVIIGTPGRLLDFASSGKLDFKGFDILVLDEADRMLDMGFLPDVRRILRALPPAQGRKTLLFSATLSTRVKHLAWEHMNNPGEIEVAPERVTVEEITQELYHVTHADKLRLLLGLLEREKPDNALIFTNMKSTAVELAKRLSHNGMPSEYIMGDLPQRKRLALINGIKDGNIKLLVATDVAARGLHIDDLDLVVNYDIPEDYELYVHRIGRTARAGKTGKAITLACERYVYGLEAIENFIGQKIPVVWPDETLFKEDATAGVRFSERRGGNASRRNGHESGGHSRPPRPRTSVETAGRAQQRSGGRRGGSYAHKGGTGETEKRNRQRPADRRSAPAGGKPPAEASLEDRLSYYREKYGEDFQVKTPKSGESGRSRAPSNGTPDAVPRGGRSGQSGRRGQANRSPQGNRPSNRGGQRSAPRETPSTPKGSASRTRGGEPNRNGQQEARSAQSQHQGQSKRNATPGQPPASSAPRDAGGTPKGAPANTGFVAKLKHLFKHR